MSIITPSLFFPAGTRGTWIQATCKWLSEGRGERRGVIWKRNSEKPRRKARRGSEFRRSRSGLRRQTRIGSQGSQGATGCCRYVYARRQGSFVIYSAASFFFFFLLSLFLTMCKVHFQTHCPWKWGFDIFWVFLVFCEKFNNYGN